MLRIYTDGSAHNNGKTNSIGGFGYIALDETKPIETYSSSRYKNTTNNRMELMGILTAIKRFGSPDEWICIYTDSNYSLNTVTEWMYNWCANGWIKSDKKEPENLDIIKEIYDFIVNKQYKIHFEKVKGHAGNKCNEIADRLANGEKI
jgi:ribonuclease HI